MADDHLDNGFSSVEKAIIGSIASEPNQPGRKKAPASARV
jgi:hypothetical protein